LQRSRSSNMAKFTTPAEISAANIVIGGYICNQAVHHDYIRLANEKMRSEFVQEI